MAINRKSKTMVRMCHPALFKLDVLGTATICELLRLERTDSYSSILNSEDGLHVICSRWSTTPSHNFQDFISNYALEYGVDIQLICLRDGVDANNLDDVFFALALHPPKSDAILDVLLYSISKLKSEEGVLSTHSKHIAMAMLYHIMDNRCTGAYTDQQLRATLSRAAVYATRYASLYSVIMYSITHISKD
jgi:hypothetical protein